MDFWARQAESRQRSRWLVVLFIAAVVAVVVAVNFVVLSAFAMFGGSTPALVDGGWVARHPFAVAMTTLGVLAFIGTASLYKTMSLSGGGGVVARSLGGVRVPADTTDAAQRRLLNVVEEMAIASGVPVPAVYVLEGESGINAFAAGHSPANAAIAVTRGALEQLDRAELQGVIGHEFSHVLNGDMRLNMRLMGLIYGLVVLSIVGRTVLEYTPRRSGSRNRGVPVLLAVAFAIMVLGYIGVFFGRLIQAAVSRQREFLADASSVQFNRDVTGLRNALLKIGGQRSSRLRHPDAESAAHMLFAPGTTQWFATHPPLAERIRALDPAFDPEAALRLEVAPQPLGVVRVVRDEAAPQAFSRPEVLARQAIPLDPAEVPMRVANPDDGAVREAGRLRSLLEARAAVSGAGGTAATATTTLLALALDPDDRHRSNQLRGIADRFGAAMGEAVLARTAMTDQLARTERLPLLEKLLPVVASLPRDARRELVDALERLAAVDGRSTIFEFALCGLARLWLTDTLEPAARARTVRMSGAVVELQALISVLAALGHDVPVDRDAAYGAGMSRLPWPKPPPFREIAGWRPALDRALGCLDGLPPPEKAKVIEAIAATITHDGVVTPDEGELLRVICARLRCPVPLLTAA